MKRLILAAGFLVALALPASVAAAPPAWNLAGTYKVTFVCTKDVRYGVELTTTLPKNGWGTYPLNADGNKRGFSNTVKGASSLVGDWKADKSGTCAVVFDPVGTALGSATIKIWSVEP